jgi:hypothetical protein
MIRIYQCIDTNSFYIKMEEVIEHLGVRPASYELEFLIDEIKLKFYDENKKEIKPRS